MKIQVQKILNGKFDAKDLKLKNDIMKQAGISVNRKRVRNQTSNKAPEKRATVMLMPESQTEKQEQIP